MHRPVKLQHGLPSNDWAIHQRGKQQSHQFNWFTTSACPKLPQPPSRTPSPHLGTRPAFINLPRGCYSSPFASSRLKSNQTGQGNSTDVSICLRGVNILIETNAATAEQSLSAGHAGWQRQPEAWLQGFLKYSVE